MTATAMKESMSLVLGTGPDAQLPDLSKPTNLVKFAALFSGDQLAKLSGEQQAVFLTTLGNHLGVRAELGEIMLYQGKPYITIDGRIRIAHNSGLLNGIDPQPASSMDRARYQVKEGEHLWKCYVLKKGALKPFVGWGHVRLNDRNPVSKSHPQEMAKKRAKYDALRLAFPPNEDITPLHQHYIQEAEDEARTRTVGSLARVSDYYDDAPDDRSVLGEEVASGGSAAADSASQSAKGVSGLSPTESATPAAAAATDTPALVEDEERAEMEMVRRYDRGCRRRPGQAPDHCRDRSDRRRSRAGCGRAMNAGNRAARSLRSDRGGAPSGDRAQGAHLRNSRLIQRGRGPGAQAGGEEGEPRRRSTSARDHARGGSRRIAASLAGRARQAEQELAAFDRNLSPEARLT
jgi:hypothetical protein